MGKRLLPVFVSIILILLPAKLIAGGNPEKGLPKVDRLIKDRNYNEAILELSVYMKENPEDFDGAQRRIKRIINMREIYNNRGIELLDVLASEPTNDAKKLEMIAYMESLEKNPNQATRDFIVGTKAAAQFTYYRAKFDEIMVTGATLIDQGLYVEAARKFTEGYVFYKQEFDDETDVEVLSQVNSSLGSVISGIGTFSEIQISFSQAITSLESAISSGDINQTVSALTVFDTERARFSKIRSQIATSGWFLEDIFAGIMQKNPLETENSFLPFAQRFTLGRKTATRFEGVLGAIDAQWNVSLNRLEKATDTTIRTLWLQGYSEVNGGNVASGITVLQKNAQFADVGRTIVASASRFPQRSVTFGSRDFISSTDRYTQLETLSLDLVTNAKQFVLYQDLKKRMDGYSEDQIVAENIRKTPSSTVTVYTAFEAELAILLRNVTAKEGRTASQVALDPYVQEEATYSKQLAGLLEADQLSVFNKSALFQEKSVAALVLEWETLYAQASSYLEGNTSSSSGVALYYPAESIIAFNKLRTGVTADRKSLLEVISKMKRVPAGIAENPQYIQSLSAIEKDILTLDSLYSNSAAGITRANSRILQANLARQESDLRYSQAQDALKKYDFQSARDNLQRSRDKINQALLLQESAALRLSSDQKIEKLGLDITRIENESVVREVRALISSGKNFYYLGNFDQAEQIFIQARNRWGVTNIEANPEVTNWLDIINTALSMKTGRTIPVSAPLYPQMSQILSSANQLYTEGKRLISTGKRAEALLVLSSAKEKIQQLQLVYPINQDAGQLTLKIDQLIDPAAFSQFFKQKVEYVRANYRNEKQTSYSDLLDLYQINPAYPGIKRLVDEVEIFLGIQIPPPDPKALARSNELTRSAQKIYDANTRSLFQVALEQLDEAIKLNPENQVAITLKDRVQTSGGGSGQSVAVLSADDEAKYQLAVQELQKGNKITASALVQQLLLNPKSRNSAKIQDLKKRIDSQL